MKRLFVTVVLALGLATWAMAQGPGKLGDLGPYRAIVVDVQGLVAKGNPAGAVTRIKDIETLWDKNARALTPHSPADWHKIDIALDRALYEVRANKPDQTKTLAALTALLTAIDQVP